jgi:predicted dehydrogenase
MSKQLRFGVIGAGGIGLHHLEALRRDPRAQIVAIAETHPGRSREAADKYRVGVQCRDYRALLARDDIDAVSIALPNHLHARVAIDALRAGKHVHLEKPMALNAREAAQIIVAAKKARRFLMVGQNMRFNRDTQMLKHFIDHGALGDIYHARAWWVRRAGIPRIGSWFTQRKFAGGGALLDIGIHMLDLALHLMGSFQPVSVSGVTHSRFGPRGLGGGGWGKGEIDKNAVFDVDDYACALIKLQGGKSLILEAAWAAHLDAPSYGVQLFGTEGGGSVYPAKIFRRSRGVAAYEVVTPELKSLPYPEERLHHFIDCVLKGKKSMVPPGQSLVVQKILDAIYKSAAAGREVRL